MGKEDDRKRQRVTEGNKEGQKKTKRDRRGNKTVRDIE